MNWLRDNMGIISNVTESAQLAASISDNEGCYFVPAFAGLGGSLVGPACSRYRVRSDRCLESRDHCACGLRVHGLPEL